MLLEDVLYNLCKQISLVLKYSKDYKDLNESSLYAESQKIALTFLKKIPLKNLLSQKNSCSFASVLLLLYVINGVLRSTLKEE